MEKIKEDNRIIAMKNAELFIEQSKDRSSKKKSNFPSQHVFFEFLFIQRK